MLHHICGSRNGAFLPGSLQRPEARKGRPSIPKEHEPLAEAAITVRLPLLRSTGMTVALAGPHFQEIPPGKPGQGLSNTFRHIVFGESES
jgi:hypothetical protein